MAILAPQDWHLPKDHAMDSSAPNGSNPAVPRQHSGSSNTNPASGPPHQHVPQPYPYPVQQQQAGWTPNHSAPPFYPSFYQNHQQHPPFTHPNHPQQSHLSPQNPYFDHAANHQFAQWAYQQMMFNAQQGHQLSHFSAHSSPQGSQRSRSGSNNTQPDYLVPSAAFSPFPSGTPPPHPPPANFSRSSSVDSPQMYNGFHPYRRPDRPQNRDPQTVQSDWRSGAAGGFQPPYARNEASGSTTSVNSASSQSSRHRTNSFQGSAAGHSNGSKDPQQQTNRSGSTNGTPRASNNGPAITSSASNPPAHRPHYRTASSSSTSSNATRTPAPSSAGPSSSSATSTSPGTSQTTSLPRPAKPSPLSQGNFTAAEKRMSRDDSDLAAMMESTPTVSAGRNGLKGRLRRALSFNASNVLQEEEEEQALPPKGKSSQGKASVTVDKSHGPSDSTDATPKKKSRTALFNSRLNASTDNISLSSTMSSASMVIRKLGNMAKLTRRNSLAGITSLFKDKKDKDDDGGESKGKKKKKSSKGAVAEASVSHVTAELDRSEWSAELNGLTPAARLARQHTLKSNAEAAAKAKAVQESVASVTPVGGDTLVPPTWEKNTTTRQGEGGSVNGIVSEEGTRIVVEEDDFSDSDDDKMEGSSHRPDHSGSLEGWDDTEDWGEDDEDVTIRGGVESINLDNEDDIDMEPWAVDVRRSLEKKRLPMKGILKAPVYTAEQPSMRVRSNSYNSAPSQSSELGPLARIPSSDPDHIDGLHNHAPHVSSPTPSTPFLPPLSFQPHMESPKDLSDNSASSSPHHEKLMFSHPNSSAPVLSTMLSSNPPTLSHRSATAPVKRLAFASNLSVYDTFPPSVYDRRSEPATWSRLTPALAQRIKEELNSYKMEEMEVHASSRVHTQFFV